MKNLMQWVLAAILICGTSGFASCGNDDDAAIVTPAAKEYFTQWNQCEALPDHFDMKHAYAAAKDFQHFELIEE